MSKYQEKPPADERYVNQSGMLTNACPDAPNGMAITKPEVEKYFDDQQQAHWADEDGTSIFDQASYQGAFERRMRFEQGSRFIHRVTAGKDGSGY